MNDTPLTWFENGMELSLVNGLTGDPCVFVLPTQSSDAILFDLGACDQLSHKNLLKVKVVCVSHTHVDHFIGFDRFLRLHIPHFRVMRFCGPSGLAERIRHKVLGYTWNLIDPGQLRFEVAEIRRDGSVQHLRFSNEDHFVLHDATDPIADALTKVPRAIAPAASMMTLSDGTRIDAVVVDHHIDCVSFSVQSPLQARVQIDEIRRLELKPGRWIRDLQLAVQNSKMDEVIGIESSDGIREFAIVDLASQVLRFEAPKAIGYVTDCVFHEENLLRLQGLLSDVDVLICESSFLKDDESKAFEKKHLTTEQAVKIARGVKARALRCFHFSKIYAREIEQHEQELARFWGSDIRIPSVT